MVHWPFWWHRHICRTRLGRCTDFKNPRDLNEKIQWLMFYSDTSDWVTYADKFAVRQYVSERIGSQYLVPLLGIWSSAQEIDFANLPDKFVIKPNNGSYDCIICTDKSRLDLEQVRSRLDRSLRFPFGVATAEAHYRRIKPLIIAEQLLQDDSPQGLVDYKIWCFHGKPYCLLVCANRDPLTHHAELLYYDLDWVMHPEFMSPSFRGSCQLERPKNLDEMLEVAARLAGDLPQVRIDLYNINGKIYFGEMTLSSNFGLMPYYTPDTLRTMGDQVSLPQRNPLERLLSFLHRHLPTP